MKLKSIYVNFKLSLKEVLKFPDLILWDHIQRQYSECHIDPEHMSLHGLEEESHKAKDQYEKQTNE